MALLPLIASVVLIGITSQYANGAGLDPDILRSRRQEDLKGCTMSSMDKCYSILPPDGTAPNTLVEEIGQVDGPQKCQAFCKDLYSNTCNWFMYDRTTKDCMLFSGSLNDLRADCNEIGYPREPSYDACDVVFSGDDGCYNFREDYCRFEFGLLDNLDDIETVAECQSACQYIQGCNYFMYDQPSKTCKLNTNVTSSRVCDILHGTPEPDLQTCIDDGKLDWNSESEGSGDSSQSIANPTTPPPDTGNWRILLPETKFTGDKISYQPVPATNALYLSNDEWILSVENSLSTRMAKIKVTGPNSFDLIGQTKYTRDEKCITNFTESCFDSGNDYSGYGVELHAQSSSETPTAPSRTDIFLAPAASLCSDFGYQVASCELCRGTIDFIKEAYPNAIEQFKPDNKIPNWNDPPHPDGCIVNVQYVQVGCNEHGTGAKNYRDQQVCVLPTAA